jgi:hypothetical protein
VLGDEALEQSPLYRVGIIGGECRGQVRHRDEHALARRRDRQ